MANKILETERLFLRELEAGDIPDMALILQDDEAMVHYGHTFTDEDVQQWLERQQRRYRSDGFGLWAACLKEGRAMIGMCGLSWQKWQGGQVPEVGYLFKRAYWHNGYALEAARACKQYAFEVLGFDEVFSQMRDTNLPSQRVAQRNGMHRRGEFTELFYGNEIQVLSYSARRGEAPEGMDTAECGCEGCRG